MRAALVTPGRVGRRSSTAWIARPGRTSACGACRSTAGRARRLVAGLAADARYGPHVRHGAALGARRAACRDRVWRGALPDAARRAGVGQVHRDRAHRPGHRRDERRAVVAYEPCGGFPCAIVRRASGRRRHGRCPWRRSRDDGRRRVVFETTRGRLTALDARTGRLRRSTGATAWCRSRPDRPRVPGRPTPPTPRCSRRHEARRTVRPASSRPGRRRRSRPRRPPDEAPVRHRGGARAPRRRPVQAVAHDPDPTSAAACTRRTRCSSTAGPPGTPAARHEGRNPRRPRRLRMRAASRRRRRSTTTPVRATSSTTASTCRAAPTGSPASGATRPTGSGCGSGPTATGSSGARSAGASWPARPTAATTRENIALDEFGHVLVLDHHANYADDSDYRDAVVQTYSRTKPKAGYNAHAFGRCDVAALQQAYDLVELHDAVQHLLRRPDRGHARRRGRVRPVGIDGDLHRDPHQRGRGPPVEQPDERPTVVLQQRTSAGWSDVMTLGGTSTNGMYRGSLTVRSTQDYRSLSGYRPPRASRPTVRRRSRSACRRRAAGRPARSRQSPPGDHPGGAVHDPFTRPSHGPRRIARGGFARRGVRGERRPPAGSPVDHPGSVHRRRPTRPRLRHRAASPRRRPSRPRPSRPRRLIRRRCRRGPWSSHRQPC